MIGGMHKIGMSNYERVNKIYYAYSDDLRYSDPLQSIWKQSVVQIKVKPFDSVFDSCGCVMLDKKKYDPILHIYNDYHWQFKLSQILDEKNTHILNSFHMDLNTVNTNLFFGWVFRFVLFLCYVFFCHKQTNNFVCFFCCVYSLLGLPKL